MRKVIFFIHMSLDGFAAGPNGEMDWIVYDEDMQKYAHSFHATTDAAIYGRVTYEMMASYWRTFLSNPSSDPGIVPMPSGWRMRPRLWFRARWIAQIGRALW